MNASAFFQAYLQRLRSNSDTVRYLAVSAASEHWYASEAAALIDANRTRYGLDGWRHAGPGVRAPRWLVVPERAKVDLSVIDLEEAEIGAAFEFKVAYNNKNLASQIIRFRSDISRETPFKAQRWGVLIYTHLIFADGQWGNYGPLGGRRAPLGSEEVLAGLKCIATDRRNVPPLSWVTGFELICNLEGANYVKPGAGCGVWAALACADVI